jgi:2-polyprenyl-3-methyl-5-hydroxy-6-metoxy-1,4-benzoquinol methylase
VLSEVKLKKGFIAEIGINLPLYSYLHELHRNLRECKSILDVGCGAKSPLRFFNGKDTHTVGVDSYKPDLNMAEKFGTHSEYKLIDALAIDKHFHNKSFDAVVLLDIIEHFNKERGHELIAKAEKVAGRRVIIVTPNGFLLQRSKDGDLQEHLSGWDCNDMKGLGYEVIGLLGLKQLRGEYHNLKYRPKILWGIAAELTHYFYTRAHPERACSLFCVKELC